MVRRRLIKLLASFALGAVLGLPTSAPALENTFETGPGGTIVTVRLTERLSSQDVTIGQTFGFETTAPVTLEDVRVPAKTPGTGVVVFARSGRGPEPGKLRLAVISLRLENGKTIAVGLEDREAGTVSAADGGRPAGLALPSAVGTIVVGGITRGNNVVYEKGTRFTLLAPPPATPAPEPEPT